MALSKKNALVLTLVLAAVALLALALCGCGGSSADETTTTSTQTTSTSGTATSLQSTTTISEAPKGAGSVVAKIGDVMTVEQGTLSVTKVTVTDDLASAAANALLLTGATGEKKNKSTKPAAGSEYLMITFTYEKDPSYAFRGGLYSDDIVLRDSTGKTYQTVETNGFGGIGQSNAGKVKPGVEAQTTAVYEVPKGLKGLTLVYHPRGADGFTCAIR